MPFVKKYWKFILAGIITLIILVCSLFYLLFNPKSILRSNQTQNTTSSGNSTSSSNNSQAENSSDGPIKAIGVNLDYYDSSTNRSGDFFFTKQKLQFNRVFMPYGFVIPGNSTSTGKDKANPQPTFVVPSGTKVLSLIDGIVFNIGKVWSGDYSIQVSADGGGSSLIFETEHVLNPVVKKGDKVKAGQVVAEVSDFDKSVPDGYGTVEIGVLQGGNPPQHLCPFLYLDRGTDRGV